MSDVENAVFVVPASSLGVIESCLILAIFALTCLALYDLLPKRR